MYCNKGGGRAGRQNAPAAVGNLCPHHWRKKIERKKEKKKKTEEDVWVCPTKFNKQIFINCIK